MRIAAIVVLTAALAALPVQHAPLDLSVLPCSFGEVEAGFHNWMGHGECEHSLFERFRRSCLAMYWSHGLD